MQKRRDVRAARLSTLVSTAVSGPDVTGEHIPFALECGTGMACAVCEDVDHRLVDEVRDRAPEPRQGLAIHVRGDRAQSAGVRNGTDGLGAPAAAWRGLVPHQFSMARTVSAMLTKAEDHRNAAQAGAA